MQTKICTECSVEKEISEFYKVPRGKFGVMGKCKECIKKYQKDYHSEHPEKKQKYRNENKNIIRERNINYHINNPEAKKRQALKRTYGITLEQYNKLFESQNGVCAICGKPETDTNNRTNKVIQIAVDHNHQTGNVRGLLCGKCNRMLGLVDDKIEVLIKAIDYLKEK